jgi:uncharacterized RDD family membrane protein YckC
MSAPSIAQSVDLASRLQRLAAQFLDGIVAGIPFVAALLVGVLLPRSTIASFVPIVAAAILGVLYTLLADGLEGGQSFGKRLVGIRVVSMTTGAPCTFGQSFVRNLLLMLLGPIDWIFIFGERHQRLGDKAGGTIVVLD